MNDAKRIQPVAARRLRINPLYMLLFAVPVALILKIVHASDLWLFLFSGIAIIPLAGLMGRATENLAESLGDGIGGLLNATFGNAAELIIGLMVLAKGPDMYPLVKASITGSIIGNILLVLGLAILVGGLRFKRQTFNRTAAGMGTTLLALAAVGLLIPSIYFYIFRSAPELSREDILNIESLSEEIAVILMLIYILSLFFSLRTHRHLYSGPEQEDHPTQAPTDHANERERLEWPMRRSVAVLVMATIGVAVMSEFLVGSVEKAAATLGLNEVFVGVIVVAIIGNAAEHSTAVMMAFKNKMDLAITIAVGSSLQIALFVAPVLVFASMLMKPAHPLDLHFTPMELTAVIISIGVLSLVSQDGESNWFEGAMLLAVYVIFALAFFHLPAVAM